MLHILILLINTKLRLPFLFILLNPLQHLRRWFFLILSCLLRIIPNSTIHSLTLLILFLTLKNIILKLFIPNLIHQFTISSSPIFQLFTLAKSFLLFPNHNRVIQVALCLLIILYLYQQRSDVETVLTNLRVLLLRIFMDPQP